MSGMYGQEGEGTGAPPKSGGGGYGGSGYGVSEAAPPSYGGAGGSYAPPPNAYGGNPNYAPDAVPPPTSYAGGPTPYPPSYGGPAGYGGDTRGDSRSGGRGGPLGGYGGGPRNLGGYGGASEEAPEKVKQCDGTCGDSCDNARIYISNLPPDVTSEELRQLFGSIGQVARIKQKRGYKDLWPWSIKLYTDEQGNNKGDAVLSYADPSVAHSAGDFFNMHDMRGYKISVSMAEKSAPNAPAYGSGYLALHSEKPQGIDKDPLHVSMAEKSALKAPAYGSGCLALHSEKPQGIDKDPLHCSTSKGSRSAVERRAKQQEMLAKVGNNPFGTRTFDLSVLKGLISTKFRATPEKTGNEMCIDLALQEYNRVKAAEYVLVGTRSMFCMIYFKGVGLASHFNFFAMLPDSPPELFFAEVMLSHTKQVTKCEIVAASPFSYDDAPKDHRVIHLPGEEDCSRCSELAVFYANNPDSCLYV